jgi:glycosyltransferase involved in cell wall biosynthesis
MPEFSIIIPTFNAEKTLAIALASILQQSFKDFEILVMDGVSTDNTLMIANSFHDDRIKIYSEKDKGIYDAMNKGIEKADGEWLYFMGSDDTFFNHEILLKVSKYFFNHDIIYGDIISTRFNGLRIGKSDPKSILHKNICHQGIFFRKSIFKKTRKFNLKYPAHADWDHNMKWILDSSINKIYINDTIAIYADGGFSSKFGDSIFEKDRLLNYLSYSPHSIYMERAIVGLIIRDAIKNNSIKTIISLTKILLYKLICKW